MAGICQIWPANAGKLQYLVAFRACNFYNVFITRLLSRATEVPPQPYNPSSAATIVLFVVDPFRGAFSNALWRCFLALQKSLPPPIKDHIVLQASILHRHFCIKGPATINSFVIGFVLLGFSLFAVVKKFM